MTRIRVVGTLAVAVSLAACDTGVACILDDPPELILTAQSTADSRLLDGLSGYVQSPDLSSDLICFLDGDHDKCYGNANRSPVRVHLARDGFRAWDTNNVRIDWVGEDCPRPVTKVIEAAMTPQGGT